MQLRGFSYGVSKPAGTIGQVQWNDGTGKFGADSGLVYTPATKSLAIGGATLTADAPGLSITQTWNNAAVAFTALKLDVTNTGSSAVSKLFDLQVGGSSVAHFRRDGSLQLGASTAISGASGAFIVDYAGYPALTVGNAFLSGVTFHDLWSYGWGDLRVYRDAADTLAQRRTTNAQTFRVYNTYTDASNYERGKFEWASNELRIGTEKAGTGSARAVAIQADGVTAISIGTSAIVSIGALNITSTYGLAGNGSNPLYGFRHSPAATTLTSYTLTAGDSGVFYIANSGSDQTFTMPASPSAGTWYGFKVSTSKSSYLRFTANTGQKIRLAGGLSASAGYVRSNTGGSFVYLMYDSTDAEWVAWQQGGTWTIDS